MFDLFLRAILHPFDYLPVIRRNTVTLMQHEEHSNNLHSFVFTAPPRLSWQAGQHGVWLLPNTSVFNSENWRVFSIASSQDEKELRITTTIPPQPSKFKKHLLSMKVGDSLTLHGPHGELKIAQPTKHIVGIAGGVGITPFRSMLYEIAHGFWPYVYITLIYSSPLPEHLFKDEFDAWQKLNPNISIIYTHSIEETTSTIGAKCELLKNRADYYISGSPNMIQSVRKLLFSKGITKSINDPFKI